MTKKDIKLCQLNFNMCCVFMFSGKELYSVLPGFLRSLTGAVFSCSFVPCQVMQNMLACKIRASIVSKVLCAFVSGVNPEVRALQDTLRCICSLLG